MHANVFQMLDCVSISSGQTQWVSSRHGTAIILNINILLGRKVHGADKSNLGVIIIVIYYCHCHLLAQSHYDGRVAVRTTNVCADIEMVCCYGWSND